MIKYGPKEEPINLVADTSLTGAGGALSQGCDLKTARIIVFWSGKFNSVQQNYPVHKREMLAIVQSLKRFCYFRELNSESSWITNPCYTSKHNSTFLHNNTDGWTYFVISISTFTISLVKLTLWQTHCHAYIVQIPREQSEQPLSLSVKTKKNQKEKQQTL